MDAYSNDKQTSYGNSKITFNTVTAATSTKHTLLLSWYIIVITRWIISTKIMTALWLVLLSLLLFVLYCCCCCCCCCRYCCCLQLLQPLVHGSTVQQFTNWSHITLFVIIIILIVNCCCCSSTLSWSLVPQHHYYSYCLIQLPLLLFPNIAKWYGWFQSVFSSISFLFCCLLLVLLLFLLLTMTVKREILLELTVQVKLGINQASA